jgi:hypothetical protein
MSEKQSRNHKADVQWQGRVCPRVQFSELLKEFPRHCASIRIKTYRVNLTFFIYLFFVICAVGARGSVVVKPLCCKPEDRGFKSR